MRRAACWRTHAFARPIKATACAAATITATTATATTTVAAATATALVWSQAGGGARRNLPNPQAGRVRS